MERGENAITILFVGTFLIFSLCLGLASAEVTAKCDVVPNPSTPVAGRQNVTGTVTFTQEDSEGDVTIVIDVTGFNTADNNKKHGFHVHEFGDMDNGCTSMGGHYNPAGVNHGAPTDDVRHVGDLGNIEENDQGAVSETRTDSVISLMGNHSILDKGIVIHAMEDDLGKEDNEGSRTTGNAGPRVACCIIQKESESTNVAATQGALTLLTVLAAVAMTLHTAC